MNKLSADTTFDEIQEYYLTEDIVLSQKKEDIRERWETIHALQLEYESDRDIISIMQNRFGISEGQAYRDMRNSEKLFGNLRVSNKEILRHLVTESAKQMYKVAKETADLKHIDKALTLIIKANNLDKEDIDLPDPAKVQPPIQVIQLSMDFLNSRFASVIDEGAKKKINEVLAKVEKLLAENYIENFLDVDTIDIPFIELNSPNVIDNDEDGY